jgi:hypothetical protein
LHFTHRSGAIAPFDITSPTPSNPTVPPSCVLGEAYGKTAAAAYPGGIAVGGACMPAAASAVGI